MPGKSKTKPNKPKKTTRKKYLPMEAGHPDDMDWEMQRFPGQWTKMVFHPRPDRPTEPNAGLVRYEPGAYHPYHTHDFAQVWYVLEGEFQMGAAAYGPGTMMFFPDPHYEDELKTETGGIIVYMQYPGPTTKACPIYDGRFNMTARKPIEEETVDV